jgi:recombination protein RecR
MILLPKSLRTLIEQFEKLPGIGPKTAQRLAFYLLHVPEADIDKFGRAFLDLKKGTLLCQVCHNVGEGSVCEICSSMDRDNTSICVVEQPLDLLAIERSNTYKGLYHVLHGAISPLNNIGPEHIFLFDLKDRIKNGKIAEIILATNSTMEGEATALYLKKMIDQMNISTVKVSRIGLGLPVGADIEYADETTLSRALQGRGEY